MINLNFLKSRFISILIFLLITLQANTSYAAVISGKDRANIPGDRDPDGDNLLEVGGLLQIIDQDNGENTMIAATVAGKYGSLTQFKAGNWRYAADKRQTAIKNLSSGKTLTDTLTVSSVDGTTHNIVITIAGVNTIVDVNQANQANAISLNWVAPSAREDSSPVSLSEIAGYKIYYGTAPGDYLNTVDIDNGSAGGYTFDALPSGTYYFVITVVDTGNRESLYSREMIKAI